MATFIEKPRDKKVENEMSNEKFSRFNDVNFLKLFKSFEMSF